MTNKNQSTALVPTPKLHAPAIKKSSHVATVKLVDDKTILEDKEEVRTKLPDILGRVLACIWIDPEFYHSFANDPKSTLEKNGVFLPQDIFLDFEKYTVQPLETELPPSLPASNGIQCKIAWLATRNFKAYHEDF